MILRKIGGYSLLSEERRQGTLILVSTPSIMEGGQRRKGVIPRG